MADYPESLIKELFEKVKEYPRFSEGEIEKFCWMAVHEHKQLFAKNFFRRRMRGKQSHICCAKIDAPDFLDCHCDGAEMMVNEGESEHVTPNPRELLGPNFSEDFSSLQTKLNS